MNFLRRLAALFRREKLDREMAEEMRFHLEQRAADQVTDGLSVGEARYAAQRKFGGVEQIKERCRDERRTVWLEEIVRDLRHGVRQLRRVPGFTTISVLTLALGIGAVTGQFSIINGMLLRGPFPHPERLVGVELRDLAWPPERGQSLLLADLHEWQRQQQTCEGLAGFNTSRWLNVVIEGTPRPLSGAIVTPNFFSVLGIAPMIGRDFSPDDAKPEAEPVALLSHAVWRSYFEGARDIVGRTVRIDSRTATVIGVMPPRFTFPRNEEIWTLHAPSALGTSTAPRGPSVAVIARLRPGITVEQATTEFTSLAMRLARETPATNGALTAVRLTPALPLLVGEMRPALLAMLGAAIAVLAIACVNVTNLQLARAASRVRELAMRSALGASRARLLRQVLTEGMLLVLAGSVAGTVLAAVTTRFFRAAMAQLPFGGVPGWVTMDLDLTVLAFTVGVAAIAILGSGLAPALFASRVNAIEVLKSGGHGQSSRFVTRVGRSLVVVQIGLGCALLIAALLQVKSIVRHDGLSYGFDLEAIVAGRIDLEPNYRSTEARRAFYGRFLRELRSEPEFAHVALTSRSLAIMGGLGARVRHESDHLAPEAPGDATLLEYVSDGYFATLGLRPRAGREFEPGEWERGPATALVNESFARKYFPHGDVIGTRIRVTSVFNAPAADEWRTIVGMVPDTRLQGPWTSHTDGAGVFLPLEATSLPYPTAVARSRAAKANIEEPLRRAVARVDPDLALYGLSTARERLRVINGQARAITGLFAVFGIVAAILAAVGLYGVASFSVAARTREFGVRMALGAPVTRVFRDVLREGAWQFLIGSFGGTALALAVTQLGDARIESFLHQVSPRDPMIYGAVILLLAVITLAGCCLPALRAAKVDPMVALRAE